MGWRKTDSRPSSSNRAFYLEFTVYLGFIFTDWSEGYEEKRRLPQWVYRATVTTRPVIFVMLPGEGFTAAWRGIRDRLGYFAARAGKAAGDLAVR